MTRIPNVLGDEAIRELANLQQIIRRNVFDIIEELDFTTPGDTGAIIGRTAYEKYLYPTEASYTYEVELGTISFDSTGSSGSDPVPSTTAPSFTPRAIRLDPDNSATGPDMRVASTLQSILLPVGTLVFLVNFQEEWYIISTLSEETTLREITVLTGFTDDPDGDRVIFHRDIAMAPEDIPSPGLTTDVYLETEDCPPGS